MSGFDAKGVSGFVWPPPAEGPGVRGLAGVPLAAAAAALGGAAGVLGLEESGVLGFAGAGFSGVLGFAAVALEAPTAGRALPIGGFPLPFAPVSAAALALAAAAERSAASDCNRSCSAAIMASSSAAAAALMAATCARSSSNALCTAVTRAGTSKSDSSGGSAGFAESFASRPLPSVPAPAWITSRASMSHSGEAEGGGRGTGATQKAGGGGIRSWAIQCASRMEHPSGM